MGKTTIDQVGLVERGYFDRELDILRDGVYLFVAFYFIPGGGA